MNEDITSKLETVKDELTQSVDSYHNPKVFGYANRNRSSCLQNALIYQIEALNNIKSQLKDNSIFTEIEAVIEQLNNAWGMIEGSIVDFYCKFTTEDALNDIQNQINMLTSIIDKL